MNQIITRPEAWTFRVYLNAYSRKATHILRSKEAVEAILPKEYNVVVRLFCWRRLSETYLVSWMGDHFKWDPCCCESDR